MLQAFEKKFRDVIQAFRSEESAVKAQLEKALQRREDLHTLPLPREDYIEMVCSFADGRIKERYPKNLKHKIAFTEGNPMRSVNLDLFNISTSHADANKIDNSLILWCFSDQIKDGIKRAIETWDYPSEVGPTRAERSKEIKQLDKDISKLQKQLTSIRGLASNEGVQLLGVSKGVKGDEHMIKQARSIAKKIIKVQ